MAHRGTSFPVNEYKPMPGGLGGPPPAYRSSRSTSETDSYSVNSLCSGMGKRRMSWTNLVESDENLSKFKVNIYPKVAKEYPQQNMSSASSVASMDPQCQISDVYMSHMERPVAMLRADPSQLNIHHASSLPPASRAPSKPPSVAMSPISLPPKEQPSAKRNRLQDMKRCCSRPICLGFLGVLVILVIVGIVLAIVLTQVLSVPNNIQMSWLPPEVLRNGQSQPTKIHLTAPGNDQIRMQLQGAIPFKGNYVSYYDFKTNRVVVVDESLRSNGKNLACFVLPLDRSNLRDEKEMRRAANAGKQRQAQQTGWQESWTWIPSPLQTPLQFNPPIKECEGARWIQLDYTGSDQKSRKCSDCYDFCLPDYGIDRQGKDSFLNIIKRNCFYLFVPEWRSYAQANNLEQNQRDFEQYYRNRNHLTTSYGGSNGESKWIPLSVPQRVGNMTNQGLGAVTGTISGAVDSVRNAFSNSQQQIQQPGVNMQPNPYQAGISGPYPMNPMNPQQVVQSGQPIFRPDAVVGLQGNDGQTGNNLYITNTAPYGQSNPGIQSNPAQQSNSGLGNPGQSSPYIQSPDSYGQGMGMSPSYGQQNGESNRNYQERSTGYPTSLGQAANVVQSSPLMQQTPLSPSSGPQALSNSPVQQPGGGYVPDITFGTPRPTYFSSLNSQNTQQVPVPFSNGMNPSQSSPYSPVVPTSQLSHGYGIPDQKNTLPQGVVGMERSGYQPDVTSNGAPNVLQPTGRWIRA